MSPQTRTPGRPGVPQPWGWEMLWTLTPRYASKVLFIRRGHEIALQVHREKEESFLVRSGRLIFVLEDRGGDFREVWLDPGDSLHVPPGRRHRVSASIPFRFPGARYRRRVRGSRHAAPVIDHIADINGQPHEAHQHG